ncbi:hypothetical protein BN1723_012372 [Verticillium longisporum]|uniref:Peptidase S33 tripeptidyl aminopeptidase-like C-terminal domain-containing protein n=2 Tax=Verticillium longisporum TaxID=100787 RepID=A0A0G4LH76_VERLO|nr:hypothetical protein BN1723_012372 [Verticillium longisporum]
MSSLTDLRSRRSLMFLLHSLCRIFTALAQVPDEFFDPSLRPHNEPEWVKFTASKALEWHPCYDEPMECARLLVPMDYGACNSSYVTLAVIRLPAQDKENYKGPLFVNPGGPGGSGVDLVRQGGSFIAEMLGANHDLISWDIRATWRSTPRTQCWATRQRRAVWETRWPGMPDQYNDDSFIATLLHRAKIQNSVCADRLGDSGILAHISTANHARDMNSILTALGEDTIRFYGASWGSALGATFATMYPDKIERMILEAFRRQLGLGFADSDALIDWFFEECANTEECAIHEPTADGVKKRFESILEYSKQNPIYGRTPGPLVYAGNIQHTYVSEAPTYSALLVQIRSALYAPYMSFGDLARLLKKVEDGGYPTPEKSVVSNPPSWWARVDSAALSDTVFRDSNNPDDWIGPQYASDEFTICGDWPELPDGIDDIKNLLAEAVGRHRLGAAEVDVKLSCIGVPRPRRRFEGPYGANTSFPILFLNARLDNITPLRSALANSALFPGSELVILEGRGHVFIPQSICMNEHARNYMQDGTMPKANTTCPEFMDILWFLGQETDGDQEAGEVERRSTQVDELKKFQDQWLGNRPFLL